MAGFGAKQTPGARIDAGEELKLAHDRGGDSA